MASDYSGGVLTRRTTISSRHTGPIYLNTYALKGIHVYYQPPIPIPDPIVLPVGWTPPQINETALMINLSKERQILEQANIRRQAIAGEVASPHTSLSASINCPLPNSSSSNTVPLIPYQSSTILTPVPVADNSNDSSSSNTSNIDKPLGEMSLRDFEGEIDPFEATALQAIDVYSELQSVLQPVPTNPINIPTPPTSNQTPPTSNQAPPTSNPSPLMSQSPSGVPPIYSVISPLPPPPPPPSSDNLYETVSASQRNNRNSFGLLVDVGGRESQHTESTPPPSIHYPLPPPSPPPPTTTSPVMRPPPPPVAPKPSSRISPNPSPNTTHRHFAGGVAVLPSINPDSLYPPARPPPPQYSSEPSSYSSYQPSPVPRRTSLAYSLPDIRSSLTNEERVSLQNISSMGFPSPRVARALKQFEGDNQKVFDFLLQVGEVEEKGYSGDSGETALLAHEQDLEKSLDYLKQVYQYKEVWPEAKIHEAYQEAGGKWDETVDILTQGR